MIEKPAKNIDVDEVAKFSALAANWWELQGEDQNYTRLN